MLRDTARSQGGQAMTEFIIGMLVFIPIVIGIIYIGKYQDIKYSAVQASRYAAFERVMDPASPSRHKTDQVIAEETRARFFTDPLQKNAGAVAHNDSTQGRVMNRNWNGTGAEPLISRLSNVAVTVQPPATGSLTANKALDKVASLNFNINDPGMAQADVSVPLARFTHFAPLNGINLTVDSKTTVLTDGFNAGGADPVSANNVHDRVAYDWGLVLGKIPGLKGLLDTITNSAISKIGWQALSDTNGPKFGCVSPDVVPADATSQSVPVNYVKNCP